MRFPFSLRAKTAALAVACLSGISLAHAADGGLYDWQPCPDSLAVSKGEQPDNKWDVTLSPYTYHWNYSPEHRPVKLVALDRQLSGGRFCGMALFNNSFGQESAYVYLGQRWNRVLDNPKLFTKVSAGLLYGYRDQYKHKIPLNHFGIAPAIIPSLGYAFTPEDSAQVFVLGNAGLLFAYTHGF